MRSCGRARRAKARRAIALAPATAVPALVVVQEDLLERGLRGCRARATGWSASAAISGPTLPRHLEAERVRARAPRPRRRAAAAAPATRPSKVTSTVCALRWRSSASVPSSTSLPCAEDADPVAERLDLAEDVRREEDGLAALLRLAHRLPEGHLHQRIETAGRLVEDQQVGAARERRDQLHLLAVARARARAPSCACRAGSARPAPRGTRRRRRRARGRGTRASRRPSAPATGYGSPAT